MRSAVAFAVLMPLTLSTAQADIYRSVDAQGHAQYSDTPSPGAVLVQRGSSSVSSLQAAASSGSTTTATGFNSAKSDAQIQDRLTQQQQSRAVAQDVAQSRAEQCKKAQEAYQKSVQARRIYTTDANGERQYLSDADADKQRLANRAEMDDACKGQ